MTFLVVLLYGSAVVCVLGLWRTWLRWRRIGTRPVLTCAEAAGTEPGTFITVAGRTAAGPTRMAPFSQGTCVWYQITRFRTRVVSSNYEETHTSVDEVWGDPGLYGVGGEHVRIEAALGKVYLLSGRPSLMKKLVADRDGGSDYATATHDVLGEWIIPPDTPAVVTGVVRLVDGETEVRQLCRAGWVDGSAHATLDELRSRYIRFVRWMIGLAVGFLASGALLAALR